MMQSEDSEDTDGLVFYGSKRLSRHEYSLKLYSSDVQVWHHHLECIKWI